MFAESLWVFPSSGAVQCVSPVASGFILRKQFTRNWRFCNWFITAKFHYYACFKTSQSPSDCSIACRHQLINLKKAYMGMEETSECSIHGSSTGGGGGACCYGYSSSSEKKTSSSSAPSPRSTGATACWRWSSNHFVAVALALVAGLQWVTGYIPFKVSSKHYCTNMLSSPISLILVGFS